MRVINGASTTSRRPARMLTDARAVKAEGCKVKLDDGQWYTDWQMGLHGAIFGYAPDWWQTALRAAASAGPVSSIRSRGEKAVARLLKQFYPDAEAVRFMCNGSDPCAAAVKLARAVTGRDKILVYGYHGTGAAFAAPPAGFDPDDNRPGTMEAERAAYQSLDWLGTYRLDEVAAVIVECPPTDGGRRFAAHWLNKLAVDAREAGALFVLDEVVTAFRYGPGGASEYYGIQGLVDLYCFGKTLGNGYPVAALAGKLDVMQWLAEKPGGGGRVHFSGTFFGEPIGLALAGEMLAQLLVSTPWSHMALVGEYLEDRWNGLGLPYTLEGHPTRPIMLGADEKFDELRRFLFGRGHIVVDHPWYATFAHGREEVDSLIEEVRKWANI